MGNIHYCTITQEDYTKKYNEYFLESTEIHAKFQAEMRYAFFSHQKRKVAYGFIRDLIKIEHKHNDLIRNLDEKVNSEISELIPKYNLSNSRVDKIFMDERKQEDDIYIYKIGEKNEETVFDLDKYLQDGAKEENKTDYIISTTIEDEIQEQKIEKTQYEIPLNEYINMNNRVPLNEYIENDNEITK